MAAAPGSNPNEYDTSHRRLGKALLINNVIFQVATMADRRGAEIDACNIKTVFKDLGLDVDEMTDATDDEIVRKLETSSQSTVQTDANPESQPVLQPRSGNSNLGHYGSHADQGNEVRVRRQDLLGSQYNMTHERLGRALVINNIKFLPTPNVKLPDRTGADEDAAKIHQRLQELGFDVDLLIDKTFSEIVQSFRAEAELDHSQEDCFFCVIMSHGDEDGIWATDRKIDLKQVLKMMNSTNCPTLIGKPKVFFVQCCRGYAKDTGCVTRMERDETLADAAAEAHEYEAYLREQENSEDIFVVPDDMDFLVVYSSGVGKSSFRDTQRGTPFIGSVCTELAKLVENEAEKDIYELLHEVNHRVAIDFQAYSDGSKQMPNFVSMLRKPFKLRKK